jgi:hypothetical protein
MIDPTKLPTAAIYWEYLAHAPVIVTVDSVENGKVYTRQRGHVAAGTIYDIDLLDACTNMHSAYVTLRSSFSALKDEAI